MILLKNAFQDKEKEIGELTDLFFFFRRTALETGRIEIKPDSENRRRLGETMRPSTEASIFICGAEDSSKMTDLPDEKKDRETAEIKRLYALGLTLQQIGDRFNLTRQGARYRLVAAGAIVPGGGQRRTRGIHTEIKAERLRELYWERRLSLSAAAAALGLSVWTVRKAMRFHQIPRRGQGADGGYLVDFLRKLAINETLLYTENPAAGYPRKLGSAAKRIGIKISIRSLGDHQFNITRIS